MANEKNLIPFTSDQNREEAKKNGLKGGKASGEARRNKRILKDLAEEILNCGVKDDKLLRQLKQFGFNDVASKDGSLTVKQAMICGMAIQAIKGNPKAYLAIKDTIEPKDAIIGATVEDLKPLAILLGLGNNNDGSDTDD